jgi:hypothetical protein
MILSFNMNSGLGDSYGGLFRAYFAYEKLIKLNYDVKVFVNIGLNPYKTHNNDRDIFKKIFNFDYFNNIQITLNDDILVDEIKKNNYVVLFNYHNIYKIYGNLKNNIDFDINEYYYWQVDDTLPKKCFFTKEIIDFCENKLKSYPIKYNSIHFRIFEYEHDRENIIYNNLKIINDFCEENNDMPIFLCSIDNDIKNKISNLNKNIFFNDFEFPDNWYTRSYNWDDEKLYDFFKETIFDMYTLSKSDKILRVGIQWFSGFLFFSSSFNQTSISNKLRYVPTY